MKPKSPSVLLFASALGLSVAFTLFGAEGLADEQENNQSEHDLVREALKRGEVQPLATILAAAAQAVPGDVIEVELEEDDDVLVYEIKVLTVQGRVREVKIEASTGKVLEVEDE